MADKKDTIQKALEDLSEISKLLALHGAKGYTLETSALDVVFLRCLQNLHNALETANELEFYDPRGDITYALDSGAV